MQDLIAEPFNLVQGSDVIARVTAINQLGNSLASTETFDVKANVQTVPHTPSTTTQVDQENTN